MNRLAAVGLCLVVSPILLVFFLLAYISGIIAALSVLPRLWLVRRMYWSCPFIPLVFANQGASGKVLRLGFEVSYTINVVKRFLTLPIRQTLPSFYIAGFPVRAFWLERLPPKLATFHRS